LEKKVFEELEECMFVKDDEAAIGELTDVLEIIHALAECHGSFIRKWKKFEFKKRGEFKKKFFNRGG
jgi:predicted house-cleaning noncanonical NTP pyrophosphatase (MazG superfamily)